MTDMHRTEVRRLNGAQATFRIYAINRDAAYFPATHDFLLQMIVTSWH